MLSKNTIHLAIELSVSSWLVAVRLPGAQKTRLHRIEGGNARALLGELRSARQAIRISDHRSLWARRDRELFVGRLSFPFSFLFTSIFARALRRTSTSPSSTHSAANRCSALPRLICHNFEDVSHQRWHEHDATPRSSTYKDEFKRQEHKIERAHRFVLLIRLYR